MVKVFFISCCLWLILPIATTAQPPVNDDSAGAILVFPIPYDDLTSDYIDVKTDGATRSMPDPACTVSTDNNDDVWFKFFPTSEVQLLRVVNAVQSSIFSAFGFALYDAAGVEIVCNNKMGTFYGNTLLGGLLPGHLYYLRFWSLHNFTSMQFSFAIMDINPQTPADDEINATPLTVQAPGARCVSPQFYTTAFAHPSGPPPGCSTDNDDDVWFRFTMPAKTVSYRIEQGAFISSTAHPDMIMQFTDETSGISLSCNLNAVGSSWMLLQEHRE